MSWTETCVIDERMKFVVESLAGGGIDVRAWRRAFKLRPRNFNGLDSGAGKG